MVCTDYGDDGMVVMGLVVVVVVVRDDNNTRNKVLNVVFATPVHMVIIKYLLLIFKLFFFPSFKNQK